MVLLDDDDDDNDGLFLFLLAFNLFHANNYNLLKVVMTEYISFVAYTATVNSFILLRVLYSLAFCCCRFSLFCYFEFQVTTYTT